jgi:hypothetical protein
MVIPGRPTGPGPESINMALKNGFRAHRCAVPGMTRLAAHCAFGVSQNVRKPALLGAVLASLIGACWAPLYSWSEPIIGFSPMSTGDVSGGGRDRSALTGDQLIAISDWLAAHRSNWQAMIVTAPAPYVVIELRHPSGERTTLDVYWSPPSPPGWTGIIVLRQFAAGKLVHGGKRTLSDQDVQAFLRLVGR